MIHWVNILEKGFLAFAIKFKVNQNLIWLSNPSIVKSCAGHNSDSSSIDNINWWNKKEHKNYKKKPLSCLDFVSYTGS